MTIPSPSHDNEHERVDPGPQSAEPPLRRRGRRSRSGWWIWGGAALAVLTVFVIAGLGNRGNKVPTDHHRVVLRVEGLH